MIDILEKLYADKKIKEHGVTVGKQLGFMLSGGDTSIENSLSEQNLLDDINKDPVRHPQVDEMFSEFKNGSYQISEAKMH